MRASSTKSSLVLWQQPPAIERGKLLPPTPALTMRFCIASPITILHAPAGFGKTCAMVAEFERLQRANVRVGWITGEALAVSKLSTDAAISAIRTIAERADVLFFDEPDRVDPAVLAAVATLMLYASPKKRVVLGARRIDDLQLSRRIAQGSAEIIGGGVLIWQRREMRAIYQQDYSAAQIRIVHEQAEGWPAPSQMLGRWLAAGGHLDENELFLERSHIAGYIDKEVLSDLPERWSSTLAATSLHPEFDQVLLDRLSPDRPVLLREIAASLTDLLTEGITPGLWRYNPLLRRQLRSRFEQLPRDERVASLNLVSDWAADRGDFVGAAHLASIAGDERRIVEFTIRAGGLGLWLNRGYDKIRSLVEVAGEVLVRSEPRLQLLHCVVLLKDGRIGEADRLYREAIAHLPPDPDAERDAAIVEATLLIYGCRAATAQDDRLFRRLAGLCVDPAWRHLPPTLQAIRHSQQAEFGAATAAIVEGISHARVVGSTFAVVFLDLHAAGIALAQGALDRAAKILTWARHCWQAEFAEDKGLETVLSAMSAQLDFERGRARQASRHLKLWTHRLPHSEAWLDVYVAGFEPMLRLLGEEHGVAAVTAAIDRSRQQLRAQNLGRIADILTGLGVCIEGEAWLFARRTPSKCSELIDPLPPTGELATWQEHEIGTLAAAYQALIVGDHNAARCKLDDLICYARDRGLLRTLQRGLLLRTAALDRIGDGIAAQADFDEALAIARQSGLRRALNEFGGPSVTDRLSALKLSSNASAQDPFLKSLTRSRLATSTTARRAMTKRERQILDELAAGGSDKTIARRLDVTEHAVRFHLKNAYVKLGVHDRAEAVSKHLLLADG